MVPKRGIQVFVNVPFNELSVHKTSLNIGHIFNKKITKHEAVSLTEAKKSLKMGNFSAK